MRPSFTARFVGALGLFAGLLAILPASGQIITTVAGNTWIFSGDGKPAINAALGQIYSVVLDSSGNVVAADANNQIVFRVSSSGTLTVLAGNGFPGFSGEGGPATSAALGSPWGVAFDAAGNLYIAELSNNRVRKVSSSGVISTFAGNATQGLPGDGG